MERYLRINDWPLASKLVGAMLVLTLVPLAFVGLVNVRNTQQALQKTISDNFTAQAVTLSGRIAAILSEQVSILQSIALNDVIKESLEERNGEYQGSDEKILAELLALDDVWRNGTTRTPLIARTLSRNPEVNPVSFQLADFEEFFPEHVEIFLTDVHGGTIGTTDLLSDYYQADEGWWQSAYNSGDGAIYISDPEFDESAGVTALLISVPVYGHGEDGILGVLRTTYVLDPLFATVGDVHVGEAGRAMLFDVQGNVLADPHGEGEVFSPEELAPLLEAEQAHYHTSFNEAGLEVIFGHAPVGLSVAHADQAGEESDAGAAHTDEGAAHTDEGAAHTDEGAAHSDEGAAHGTGDAGGEELTPIDIALENLSWTAAVRQDASEALAPVAASTRLAVFTLIGAGTMAVLVAILLARVLTRQVESIQRLFSAIGIGEFDARSEVLSGDELGQMAGSLNAMLDNTLALVQTREERDAIQLSIQKLLDEVSGAGEGDLTVEAEVTADATGAIADSFNLMVNQLRGVIGDVQEATSQVSSSAAEIQATAEHLSQGSENQATRILDASTAIEEMAASIHQVSENSSLSAKVGAEALENANKGTLAVENTVTGMNRIRDQVQETGKRIKRLGESSQEIGEIVALIGDIADRTSILALNASIQAAMAGEAGQGFAVVAEEVERLAERSTEATQQIETLIRTIQNEMNEAAVAMEATTNEVVEGSQLADEAGSALREIETVSERLAQLIQSISQAATQQARGSESLAQTMGEIAGVTQQTAAGTKQAATSINSLASLADGLRESVGMFKLPGENGREVG